MFPSPHSNVDPLPFLLSDYNINFPSSPVFPLDNNNYSSSSSSSSSSSIFLQPLMNMENHTTSMVDDVSKAKKQAPPAPRKRSSKKDRHSKIYTAKGLRDRRMRLSLDVARRFFDLQDMLGLDKASKTVEWLLKQSESSIELLKKTLIANNNEGITNMMDYKLATSGSSSSPSITSECNVAYEMLDGSSRKIINSRGVLSGSSSSNSRVNVDPSIVRESRKMARARAKERTMEKMWIQSLNNGWKLPHQEISRHVEESSQLGQRFLKPSMEEEEEEEEEEDAKQQLLGLGEEHVLSGGHPQEHLYRDLQLLSKPWEAFNGSTYI